MKVSVIVPCYNQAHYLEEALDSVLKQTHENWECIIVDDGSKDHTKEISERLVLIDNRFRYFNQENKGVSYARNLGIENARGKYILPLDADDRISPKYIEKALQAFQKDRELTLVYCRAEKFGKESGKWELAPFSLYTMSRKNVIFCSALYKKEDWERVGGYDTNMTYGIEDWEFWIALLKNGEKVRCLDITGFYYRVRDKSRTKLLNDKKIIPMYEYMNIKHADFFVKHYGPFITLEKGHLKYRTEVLVNQKSEKYVIDLFCKTFFGFTLFGKIKK